MRRPDSNRRHAAYETAALPLSYSRNGGAVGVLPPESRLEKQAASTGFPVLKSTGGLRPESHRPLRLYIEKPLKTLHRLGMGAPIRDTTALRRCTTGNDDRAHGAIDYGLDQNELAPKRVGHDLLETVVDVVGRCRCAVVFGGPATPPVAIRLRATCRTYFSPMRGISVHQNSVRITESSRTREPLVPNFNHPIARRAQCQAVSLNFFSQSCVRYASSKQ